MTRLQRHQLLHEDKERIEWLNEQPPRPALGAAMLDYRHAVTNRPARGAGKQNADEQVGDLGNEN